MNRRATVAAMLAAVLLIGGAAVALHIHRDRSRPTASRPRTATTRSTTTRRSVPSTAASTTHTAPTTAKAPAVTASTAPAPAPTAPAATAPSTVPLPSGPAPAGLGAVRGRTIAIDAGHNGANGAHASEIARPIFIGTQTRACDTTGTETNDGYTESAYNLDVALRLESVLQAAGANVVMVRTTNDGWGPCIDERAAIGNRAHADAAISIHADGGPAGGRGFHVNMPALIPGYTDDIYAASARLGTDVRDAFLSTGMPESTYIGSAGLVQRSDLGGLNLSNVPKVLVETGNMRNAVDAALLESADFRQREAAALAEGIAEYLGGR